MKQIIAKKVGMTRLFTEDGKEHAVTAVRVPKSIILDHRTDERDGYQAYIVGVEPRTKKRPLTKAKRGIFEKTGLSATKMIRELRIDGTDLEVGADVAADIFEVGDIVKVRGATRGRGFQGVVKRYGFRGGGAAHGHRGHRIPGSIGASASPSRVWPGKKMPGRMGGTKRTIKGIEIMQVDAEKGLLVLRGALPGPPGGELLITTDDRTKA